MPQTEWAQSFKEWASAWSAFIYSGRATIMMFDANTNERIYKGMVWRKWDISDFLFGAKVLFDESNSQLFGEVDGRKGT